MLTDETKVGAKSHKVGRKTRIYDLFGQTFISSVNMASELVVETSESNILSRLTSREVNLTS